MEDGTQNEAFISTGSNEENAAPASLKQDALPHKRHMELTDNDGPAKKKQKTEMVAYIFSPRYVEICSLLPIHSTRVCAPWYWLGYYLTTLQERLVHGLVAAYGLLQRLKLIAAPESLPESFLEAFHSPQYIAFLKSAEQQPIEELDETDQRHSQSEGEEGFGLQDDCPPFPHVFKYASVVAAATIAAARELMSGYSRIAMNVFGGRHHAKADEASGYCYVNDIVLGIMELLKKFQRVMYIDIDVHHGDGVEEAFYYSDRVLTISFHQRSPGFFPGSGAVTTIGAGRGKYFTINVPLKEGVNDDMYLSLFRPIVEAARQRYCPEVVVLQCGSDGLAGDPLGGFNLSSHGLLCCVDVVRSWGLPMLVLGGGGYHSPNVARWITQLVGLLVSKPTGGEVSCGLPEDIPEHAYYMDYAPSFTLHVPSLPHIANRNTREEIDALRSTVLANIERISLPATTTMQASSADIPYEATPTTTEKSVTNSSIPPSFGGRGMRFLRRVPLQKPMSSKDCYEFDE